MAEFRYKIIGKNIFRANEPDSEVDEVLSGLTTLTSSLGYNSNGPSTFDAIQDHEVSDDNSEIYDFQNATLPGALASDLEERHPSVFSAGQRPLLPRATLGINGCGAEKSVAREPLMSSILQARKVLFGIFPKLATLAQDQSPGKILTKAEKTTFRKRLEESYGEEQKNRHKVIRKLASLSKRSIDKIAEINRLTEVGQLKERTSAITTSTFDFLQGIDEAEQYRKLCAVASGEITIKDLNSDLRKRRRASSQISQPKNSSETVVGCGEENGMSGKGDVNKLEEELQRSREHIRILKKDLNDATEEIRKGQKEILKMEEELRDVYDSLKRKRTHHEEYKRNTEKRLDLKDSIIANLREQLENSLREGCICMRTFEDNFQNSNHIVEAKSSTPITDLEGENARKKKGIKDGKMLKFEDHEENRSTKKKLENVSIDGQLLSYATGSSELDSSFAESNPEIPGPLPENNGFIKTMSTEVISDDGESGNDETTPFLEKATQKIDLKTGDFVAYTCMTSSFYLGRVIDTEEETSDDEIAVEYGIARPNNEYDFSKRKRDFIRCKQIFKKGEEIKAEYVKIATWRVDRSSLEKEHQLAVKKIKSQQHSNN